MRLMIRAVMMAVVAASLAACASAPADMSSEPTLYQRLGGRVAVNGRPPRDHVVDRKSLHVHARLSPLRH